MPTRKTITTVEDTPPESEVVEVVDEVEEAAESALDGLLAEFSGADDVTVNIYRQGEGKNLRFLFKTMPEESNGGDIMERCRDQHGTGDYRMHVREGRRLVANRSFSVEAPAKPEPVQPQQFGVAELMAMMTKQNENMQTMFASTLTAIASMGARDNTPAVDPVAQQTALIEGVRAMREIAAPADTGPSGVEMLIRGLELAKDMAPKTGETNANDIFLKALEAFPALAQAGRGGGAHPMQPRAPGAHPMMPGPRPGQPTKPPAPTTPQPPNPTTPPPPQPEAPADDPETVAFIAQARHNLQYLCRLASQNKNPELYAEVVIDNMGREAVVDFIGHDNALEQLAAIEPAVGLYPGWFAELKEAILTIASEETVPDEGPVEQGGEGAPISDDAISEVVPLTPDVVLSRINESGLRREGQQDAPVLIPSGDPEVPDTKWDGGNSEPASDT